MFKQIGVGLATLPQTSREAVVLLQSSLLAMHEAFLVSSLLTIVALLAMCFVPRRRKSQLA